MSDEFTRAEPEDLVCDCRSSAWVCRTGGWYCCHCGQWQCSISGRVAIRDPEPFQFYNPIARRRVSNPSGPANDPVVTCDYAEIDYALLEAFTNDWEPDPDSDG